MTDNVVVFDVAEFREDYPFFQNVSDRQLNRFFKRAENSFLKNTNDSCIEDLEERKDLLYLIVAHLATLFQQAESGNTLVGRISSATQGSVSVSSDYGTLGKNEKWWVQTKWGADYWAATAQYRTSQYVITKFPMPVDRRGYPRNRFYN